jgi:hypothetical protein
LACRKSRAAGVGHVANLAASVNVVPECRPLSVEYPAAPLERESSRVGVGQPDGTEEEALPDVRSADARSAQIRSPDGVARSFQVSANNVEPREASPACNLLAKHDWRAALADEAEPLGPEVAGVIESCAVASIGEGLAGTGAGPHMAIVGPASEPERVGPGSESGEGVELSNAHKVICAEIADRADIDTPAGDVPGVGQVEEPVGGEGLDLVVERGDHGADLGTMVRPAGRAHHGRAAVGRCVDGVVTSTEHREQTSTLAGSRTMALRGWGQFMTQRPPTSTPGTAAATSRTPAPSRPSTSAGRPRRRHRPR